MKKGGRAGVRTIVGVHGKTCLYSYLNTKYINKMYRGETGYIKNATKHNTRVVWLHYPWVIGLSTEWYF